MIRLFPQRIYRIYYKDGQTREFQTLDKVPEAMLTIKVKDIAREEEVELVSLLSEPWLDIEEQVNKK